MQVHREKVGFFPSLRQTVASFAVLAVLSRTLGLTVCSQWQHNDTPSARSILFHATFLSPESNSGTEFVLMRAYYHVSLPIIISSLVSNYGLASQTAAKHFLSSFNPLSSNKRILALQLPPRQLLPDTKDVK